MSPMHVGERIRQLRLGLGLSIRAFAAEAGFSPSLISQVEHGHVMPSIGSLERIAMALGVSLSTFFAEPETDAAGLVRVNVRQKLTSTWSPVAIESLRPAKGVGMLEPVLITLAPQGRSGKFPTAHVGEKFVLVLDGEVALTLGDEVHGLRTGDAITFASAIPHHLENTSTEPAHVVIVSVRVRA
jgi:transcriptional regulator with XRE-family HTH domain